MSKFNSNSNESSADGPVDILPIPPALEFPFGHTSSSVSQSSRKSSGQGLGEQQEGDGTKNLQHAATAPLQLVASEDAATRALLDRSTNVARPPHLRRSAGTEGPSPRTHRPTAMGRQRAVTGVPQNALSSALEDESDSSSSSDGGDKEGLPLAKQPSKASDLAGSTRRPSDDPYRSFKIGNPAYQTRGHVSKRDGRLKISLKETEGKGYLAKTLGATLLQRTQTGDPHSIPEDEEIISPLRDDKPPSRPGLKSAATGSSVAASLFDERPIPRLNIVIMVIGSRGDIQPFLRLGKMLKEDHGHRVRIATHPAFKDFVEKDTKLEFFSVGGDPSELMAFMVKNPGLIPKTETIRQGEIARRRDAMYEMFQGFWRACIDAEDDRVFDEMGAKKKKQASKGAASHKRNAASLLGKKPPFIADAIIANPPSFAHIHCAERLGVPLHLMFTFPTSPTQKFPHPLANIQQSNVDANYTNFMSYPLVEMMQWQGLGDLINKFRINTLELDPVSTLWAPGQLFRLRVPHTYMWSPTMIEKPADWGPEIDITGFVFLDLASSFKPAQELVDFLEAGEPPIYIGFGSIVVDDPDRFTELIFEAVKKAGVRALVSKGWGGLGDEDNTPENIYMLGNTPHDWLFPRVSAVIHHGGAGTTAIGMKCGRPTMIVPFFGDQPFWGAMVHAAGAGAEPVPYKKLTSDILAEGIKELLTEEKQAGAKELSRKIEEEGDGAANAVKSFHRSLPLRGNHSMRCSILEDRVAVWWLRGRHVRLSSLAAEILIEKKKIKWSDLRLIRHYEWSDFEGPGEPITGAGSAISRNMGRFVLGVGSTPFKLAAKFKEKNERASQSNSDLRNNSEQSSSKGKKTKKSEGENTSKHVQEQTGESKKPDLPVGNTVGQPLSPQTTGTKGAGPGLDGADANGNPQLPRQESLPGEENWADEIANETGKGFKESGKGLMNLPVDLSLALAQGFHNAPRLWGDDTVRAPTRVTGIKSGFRAAGREFGYGIYDGWTGVVKHPYRGAKKEGALGFTKGVGKGIGGFVLKDLSALFALPAYPMKGIAKEFTKKKSPVAFVRRAHIIQGRNNVNKIPNEELTKIIDVVLKGWDVVDLIGKELDAMTHSGLRGRLELLKGKSEWKGNAVFENVEMTSRALQAYKEGRDFDEEFQQHKKEVQKQLGPRKPAMRNSMSKETSRTKNNGPGTEVAGEQTGTLVQDKADGTANGTANGNANGTANGMSNGTVNEDEYHKNQSEMIRTAIAKGDLTRPAQLQHTASA